MRSRKWTDEEIAYLKESVGDLQVKSMALKLGRTQNSVINKLKRLGLANTREHNDGIPIGQLSRMINVDRTIIQNWVERHGLKASRKITRSKKRFWFVTPQDFWVWAEQNKDKVKFSDIPYRTLVPEPDWVNDERKKDWNADKRQPYKQWTLNEVEHMIHLRDHEGLTFKQIAHKLGRTEHSIARKYHREKDTKPQP